MCGISGLLGNGDSSIASSMAARLAHRGPDGSGKFGADVGAGAVALAQARLAIVDLNGSWQPIQSEHNCVLIQNGEIYNHLSLFIILNILYNSSFLLLLSLCHFITLSTSLFDNQPN